MTKLLEFFFKYHREIIVKLGYFAFKFSYFRWTNILCGNSVSTSWAYTYNGRFSCHRSLHESIYVVAMRPSRICKIMHSWPDSHPYSGKYTPYSRDQHVTPAAGLHHQVCRRCPGFSGQGRLAGQVRVLPQDLDEENTGQIKKLPMEAIPMILIS